MAKVQPTVDIPNGDCDDLLSESDDENYYQDYDEDESYGPQVMHSALQRDIKLFQENVSSDCLTVRSLSELNEVDLDFSFHLSFLENSVKDAWGLLHEEPVVIRLSLNQAQYLASDGVKKVEVIQKSSRRRQGTLAQIKNLKYFGPPPGDLMLEKSIVEEFCRVQFRELDNDKLSKAISEHRSPPVNSIPHQQAMSEILEMGFAKEDIMQAFHLTDGSKEEVVQFLLMQLDSFNDLPIDLHHTLGKHQKVVTPKAQNTKEFPCLNRGFLVQFYLYMMQRLSSLNNYCPICDRPHNLSFTSMLKPVVCDSQLCTFSSQTLGVMSDVMDVVKAQPLVIDLLLHLTKAAAISERHHIILSPYPTLVDPTAEQEIALHANKKDHELLREVLSKLPPVTEIDKLDELQLQENLNSRHALCYPLLRWVIFSNRSHIVRLPDHKQLSFMGTKHQYVLLSSPPAEEKRFGFHVRNHGSVFAFHGSPIENWHSIIREGLLVASGTDRQLHGAAYGKGIYLSPTLSTSLNYCRALLHFKGTVEKKKSKKEKKEEDTGPLSSGIIKTASHFLTCITLCEVVKCPNLKKHGVDIWTCDSSEYVCTRFFFVYNSKNIPSATTVNVNMTQDMYMNQVREALAEQGRK